jgi:tetratricopeptide (TPR) repeat protein
MKYFRYSILLLFFFTICKNYVKGQLLHSDLEQTFHSDPIEKSKANSLKNLFKDQRFNIGYFLYINFFSDLNIVVLENQRTKIYKPAVSKRILFYAMDNLAEVNEAVIQDYFERGLARIDSGKYEEAMNDFDKALLYDPENADVYLNRGVLFIYSQQFNEALQELDKAEKYDKKNPGICFNRGLIFYNQNRFKDALVQLDQSIKLDEEYTRAYFEKGMVLDALGQTDEALKALKKARNLGDPDANQYIQKIKDRKSQPSNK